jgi:hypothetical protein
MSVAVQTQSAPLDLNRRLPLLQLLHPRRYAAASLISLLIGLTIGVVGIEWWGLQRWHATAIVLVAMLPVGVLKFRDDRLRYGGTIMLMSILLTSQGAHTIEHIVQWAQYHLLFWTMRQSNGLLSAANAEWVHFVWNWGVLLIVLVIFWGGVRNFWAYLLLGITIAHTFEHTYLFVRHLQVLGELRELGVTTITAQGLPGILGRDGWLARSPVTQGTLLCSLPGLTTATRLDVHFWWNVIEMSLLLAAGHVFLRRQADSRFEA